MMSMRRPLLWLFLAAGGYLMIDGSYIHLKAMLGQWLINQAWGKSEGQEIKPWSWMDSWPVAKLHIPRLDIHQVVLAGDSGQALAFAPGHRTGSALPGESGTTLISGHRDTHFRFMGSLQRGDTVIVEDLQGRMTTYRIDKLQVVEADSVVAEEPGVEMLVLATCWPLDDIAPATQRLLAFGHPAIF